MTRCPFAKPKKPTPGLLSVRPPKRPVKSCRSPVRICGTAGDHVPLLYGSDPWGRPEATLFKFVDAVPEGRPIDVCNHGDMYRDFTYVDDLVRGIRLLIDAVPERPTEKSVIPPGDSLSPVAPLARVQCR